MFEFKENSRFLQAHFVKFIENENPNFHCCVEDVGSDTYIRVTKLQKGEMEDFEKKEEQRKMGVFQELIGFSRVWEALKKADKPFIGHNSSTDFLFMFEHFEYSLGHDYEEYKTVIGNSFRR